MAERHAPGDLYRRSKRERMRDEAARPVEDQLAPDLALLLAAIRGEFDAKLSGLWWRYLAVSGIGGTVGGIITRLAAPAKTNAVLSAIASIFS